MEWVGQILDAERSGVQLHDGHGRDEEGVDIIDPVDVGSVLGHEVEGLLEVVLRLAREPDHQVDGDLDPGGVGPAQGRARIKPGVGPPHQVQDMGRGRLHAVSDGGQARPAQLDHQLARHVAPRDPLGPPLHVQLVLQEQLRQPLKHRRPAVERRVGEVEAGRPEALVLALHLVEDGVAAP